MNSRMRSLVVLVVVLSAAAAALLLGQSLRSRVQLRDQVLEQVQRFSLNLSDAMAGQVQGLFSSIDLALMQVRREWPEKGRSAVFESDLRETLASLPAGLVSHVVMANAQGDVVFNSPGVSGAVNIADRDYFKGHLGGGDKLARFTSPCPQRHCPKTWPGCPSLRKTLWRCYMPMAVFWRAVWTTPAPWVRRCRRTGHSWPIRHSEKVSITCRAWWIRCRAPLAGTACRIRAWCWWLALQTLRCSILWHPPCCATSGRPASFRCCF